MAHAADGTLLGGDYDSERAASAMRVLRLGQDDLAAILDGAQKDIAQMTGLMGAAAK